MEKNKGFEEEFNLEQMEKETEEMLRMRYITKANAEFKRTEGGFVSLKIEDEFYEISTKYNKGVVTSYVEVNPNTMN